MSRYEVNGVLFKIKMDREFRARFQQDPQTTLAGADLTETERDAFLGWDLLALNRHGALLHLLLSVPKLSLPKAEAKATTP